MKPPLERKWRLFGFVFGAIVLVSVMALVAFEVFYAIPLARQVVQISETNGLKASQQALARNPNDTAALRGMAREMSVYRKDLPAAISYLKRAVEIEPDNLNNHYWLAFNLLRAGRGAEAKPLLEKVAAGNDINKKSAQKVLAKLKKNPHLGADKPPAQPANSAQNRENRQPHN